MPLSVVDLYRDILPKTNCGDCGYLTCLAFASMVVSEKLPLKNCPYIDGGLLSKTEKELNEQYSEGKWLKKDLAHDALQWAKERASSMNIEDLPGRIGGELKTINGEHRLVLPYFTEHIIIKNDSISHQDGSELNRWEQVFIYNHMAQGGSAYPTGKWKAFEEIPNTVSKVKSMRDQVEMPLLEEFKGNLNALVERAKSLGSDQIKRDDFSSDAAFLFRPLPRIPVMLLFWDEDVEEAFEAKFKLLFDETITEHLDIESIMFLSERLRQLLCENHKEV